MTDPDGDVTSYTYDSFGDVASSSLSPANGVTDTTTYAYDADSERTCQASPDATAAGVVPDRRQPQGRGHHGHQL